MPSIIIKEKDLTTSPAPDYANFTVVVPGIYDPAICTKPEEVFDANGIFECTSQSDFKAKVGLAAAIGGDVTAKWAEPQARELKEEVEVTFDNLYVWNVNNIDQLHFMSQELFWTTFNGCVYELIPKTPATKTEPAVWEWDTLECGAYKFEYKVDETTKKYYKFNTTPVTAYPSDLGKKFVVLFTGKEGRNKVENTYRLMGNQIAYELLGLGYTVLYKKVEPSASSWDFTKLDTEDYWSCLLDKSAYDFRYITLGGYNSAEAQNIIASVAKLLIGTNTTIGRGDTIALIDIDDQVFIKSTSQKSAAEAIEAYAVSLQNTDKNTAFFAPTVTYNMTPAAEFEENKTFPASFHYLACAAKASENYAEWYAVAGYTRGVSDLSVARVSYKFGDIAANALAPRTPAVDAFKCVNLIVTEKNNYYIWGNRTAEPLDKLVGLKASHFLNIRQLCTTLNKRLYVICRQATFEPNSDILWVKFCSAIRPTLDGMKADQGLSDYKILKVINNAKAKLTAIIRIVPIEAVEDFDITLYLEDDLNGGISAEVVEG